MTPPKRTAKKAATKAPAKKAAAKKPAAKKAPAKKAAPKKAPAKKPAAKSSKSSKSSKTTASALLVSKSRTKDYLKARGKRSGDDVIAALNAEVLGLLDKASMRAEGNGRRTVRPSDF